MKRCIFAVIFYCISMGPTLSADLNFFHFNVHEAKVPTTWNGLYIGMNAGSTILNSSSTYPTTWNLWPNPENIDQVSQLLFSSQITTTSYTNFSGGLQIGANYRFLGLSERAIASFETDIQGMPGSGATSTNLRMDRGEDIVGISILSSLQQTKLQLQYLGTMRGRIGYVVTSNLLIYGTGGLAYGGAGSSLQNDQYWTDGNGTWKLIAGRNSSSQTMLGWTAGGGGEWFATETWSLKAEYLYYDLGRITNNVTNTGYGLQSGVISGLQSITRNLNSINGDIFRVGINFHFNTVPLKN